MFLYSRSVGGKRKNYLKIFWPKSCGILCCGCAMNKILIETFMDIIYIYIFIYISIRLFTEVPTGHEKKAGIFSNPKKGNLNHIQSSEEGAVRSFETLVVWRKSRQ